MGDELMTLDLWQAFIFSFAATEAFAVLFQAPKKTMVVSGVIGAMGWLVFVLLHQHLGSSSFYAKFVATVTLSLVSELSARLFKQPVTTFVVPGITPLVPGLGMYHGMTQIIYKSYNTGIDTLLTAGMDASAIALGIMLITSVFRVVKIGTKPLLMPGNGK